MKISAKSLVHFARTAKNYMRSALSYILHRFRIRGLVVTEYQSGFPGNVALVLAHRYPANFRRSPSTFRCRRIARRIFQVSPPHSGGREIPSRVFERSSVRDEYALRTLLPAKSLAGSPECCRSFITRRAIWKAREVAAISHIPGGNFPARPVKSLKLSCRDPRITPYGDYRYNFALVNTSRPFRVRQASPRGRTRAIDLIIHSRANEASVRLIRNGSERRSPRHRQDSPTRSSIKFRSR